MADKRSLNLISIVVNLLLVLFALGCLAWAWRADQAMTDLQEQLRRSERLAQAWKDEAGRYNTALINGASRQVSGRPYQLAAGTTLKCKVYQPVQGVAAPGRCVEWIYFPPQPEIDGAAAAALKRVLPGGAS